MLTVTLAHARFDDARRAMLPGVLDTWDGIPDVICDDHRAGAWATVREGWERALATCDHRGHVMVAQDDFRLAAGGHKLIAGLCDRFPDRVMSFRWPAHIDPWAGPWVERDDACWLQTSYAWTGGAVVLPADVAADFLAWAVDYERVLRARRHRPEFLDHVLRHRDDFRLDLFLIARGHTVWRCRWSLLQHLGDEHSVVQGGPRTFPSREMHLVDTVDDLPAVDDPRWVGDDAPSAMGIHVEYRSSVERLFGDRAHELGLGHARW